MMVLTILEDFPESKQLKFSMTAALSNIIMRFLLLSHFCTFLK